MIKLQLFIDGEWCDSESSDTFEDLNPIDDSIYASVAKGNSNDK